MPRVLDAEPVADLDAYVAAGGGRGLRNARAGTRTRRSRRCSRPGCGDAVARGFPTGRKWETVAAYESSVYCRDRSS